MERKRSVKRTNVESAPKPSRKRKILRTETGAKENKIEVKKCTYIDGIRFKAFLKNTHKPSK